MSWPSARSITRRRRGVTSSGSTGSSIRPIRCRPAGPMGSPFRTGCGSTCCVMARSPRRSRHRVARCRWVEVCGTCRTARGGWCCVATASAEFRVVRRPGGCRSTTLSTRPQAAATTPPTWSRSVPHDHRLHHRGQLGIIGNADDPDGLVFTDADGRVIDPAAHPTKPTGPPPSPAHPYQHPLGERLQHWALLYPDPPRPAA